MNLTQSLVNAYNEPSFTSGNKRAYRHIINTVWHEAIHTHGYNHGPTGYGDPDADRASCGIPPDQDPYIDAPNLVDQCMNVVVRDSVQYCSTMSCPDGSIGIIDGYNSTSCTCVQDPQLEAELWSPAYRDGSTSAADYDTITFADIDGDGRDDLCGIQGSVVRCQGATPLSVSPPAFNEWTRSIQGWDVWNPIYRDTLKFPDVNGDGRADACIRQRDGIYCAVTEMAPPTGSCAAHACPYFRTPTRWTSGFSDSANWHTRRDYYETIQYADLNGDGRDDVCGRGRDGIWCGYSSGSSFSNPRLHTTFFSDANNWHTDPSYWSTIRLVDVSGDGRADVCGRSAYGIYCGHYRYLYRDFGTVRLRESTFNDPSWKAPEYYETIEYGDINNDGTQDVCGRGIQGIHCGLYGGSSEPEMRFTTSDRIDVVDFTDALGWDARKRYVSIRVVDVDGDGRSDVCGRGAQGIYCARSASGLFVRFKPSQLWVANFGDDKGWGASPSHYETVQPARVSTIYPEAFAFCGRGYAGIWCSWR